MDEQAIVRPRRPDDLDTLEGILRRVYQLDGYPVEGVTDPRSWLLPDELEFAWVAEIGGHIAGHLLLTKPGPSDAAARLWMETSQSSTSDTAVIGRLFVSPKFRGKGLGSRLLRSAEDFCAEAKIRAVLEVLEKDSTAIRLYRSHGWRVFGKGVHQLDNGQTFNSLYFTSPMAKGVAPQINVRRASEPLNHPLAKMLSGLPSDGDRVWILPRPKDGRRGWYSIDEIELIKEVRRQGVRLDPLPIKGRPVIIEHATPELAEFLLGIGTNLTSDALSALAGYFAGRLLRRKKAGHVELSLSITKDGREQDRYTVRVENIEDVSFDSLQDALVELIRAQQNESEDRPENPGDQ